MRWVYQFFSRELANVIEMTLRGKVCGELVNLYYRNGINDAKALRVYHQNHLQTRGPRTPEGLHDLIKKFQDMACACD